MAFEIAPEADPLVAEIFKLLSPIAGIEARLAATNAELQRITAEAINAATLDSQQGFGSLADFITETARVQTVDARGIMNDIVAQANLDSAAILSQLNIARGEFSISIENLTDQVTVNLDLAASNTSTLIQQETSSVLGAFDVLGGNIKDAVFGIPEALVTELNPIFGAIINSISGQSSVLGSGFEFLGMGTALGFSLLSDVIRSIFAIDPQDFQAGIERMIPAMMDIAKTVGDTILEE